MAGYPLLQASSSMQVCVSEASCSDALNKDFCRQGLVVQSDFPTHTVYLSDNVGLDEAYGELLDKTSQHKRRMLLFAGGWLEGAVTQLSVRCLIEGFDVFIAADACLTDEPDYRDWFLKRLHSYGATISTTRQLAMELTVDQPHSDLN